MTNTNLLKGLIVSNGLTIEQVAKRMGLSYHGLYNKICNISEFKSSEIKQLTAILNIPDEQIISYFFNSDVE